jgi:hypothetical protein
MNTVYVLLVLAVLVLVGFALYVTRPPSRKKSADSVLKEPVRNPTDGSTKTLYPDALPPLDYPKSNAVEDRKR